MEFNNFTPFPAIGWETVNCDNEWFASNVVRVKFSLVKTKEQGEFLWQLDPDQGELFDEDVFHRDDIDSSVRYESDFVPYKPYTDIVFNARAYKPKDEPFKSWDCGVQVYDEHGNLTNQQTLSVVGPHKHLFREKVDEVAIRYEKSKGGIVKIKNKGKEDEEVAVDLYNPVGCGKFDLENKQDLCSVQITYADKAVKNIPPGLGFIHRGWKNRLDHAGTYDQQWQELQHPLPPKDFSPFHHQAAHPNLIAKSYLKPGSKIELRNLIQDEETCFFMVPEYQFLARLKTNTEKTFAKMNLDTVIIDIDSDNIDEYGVYASWRSYTKLTDDLIESEVMLIPNKNKKG